MGTDPIVLDLQGMGKGFAWVNGFNIGRYWPTYIADEDGCDVEACDYRGSYGSSKCLTNCGQPTQRWWEYFYLIFYILIFWKLILFLLNFNMYFVVVVIVVVVIGIMFHDH